MNDQTIIYEVKDSLAYIKLNRPESLNALNQQLLEELDEVLNTVKESDEVKVVIITGVGDKAFAAGADINELKDMTSVEAMAQAEWGNKIFTKLSTLPQPVIAAVNGYSLGGGFELALASDIRFVSDNAQLGLPEVGLGIMPGYGGTQRLSRLIGLGRAKQLVFSAENIDAEEAYRLGIANKVVEQSELLNEVEAFAKTLLTKSSKGIRMAKKTIENGYDITLEEALNYEASNFGVLFSETHQKEGMAAFLEKRKPNFD